MLLFSTSIGRTALVARPQLENGFVQIAHEVLHALLIAETSRHERAILAHVLSSCYGPKLRRRSTVTVDVVELARIWKCDPSVLRRALKRLIERRILADLGQFHFRFNKDWQSWVVGSVGLKGSMPPDTALLDPDDTALVRAWSRLFALSKTSSLADRSVRNGETDQSAKETDQSESPPTSLTDQSESPPTSLTDQSVNGMSLRTDQSLATLVASEVSVPASCGRAPASEYLRVHRREDIESSSEEEASHSRTREDSAYPYRAANDTLIEDRFEADLFATLADSTARHFGRPRHDFGTHLVDQAREWRRQNYPEVAIGDAVSKAIKAEAFGSPMNFAAYCRSCLRGFARKAQDGVLPALVVESPAPVVVRPATGKPGAFSGHRDKKSAKLDGFAAGFREMTERYGTEANDAG